MLRRAGIGGRRALGAHQRSARSAQAETFDGAQVPRAASDLQDLANCPAKSPTLDIARSTETS